jgi:hypothetical protein
MGSGFKTFAASEVLTAANLNNYCQNQSVMYFLTTTARDAAITSPVDGMTAYIGSNDSSEGLYTYNGTSWRRGPGWNAPWGRIASSSKTTTTSLSTTVTDVTSVTFTAVANRYYKTHFFAPYLSMGAAGACDVYLTDAASTQITVANFSPRGLGLFEPVNLMYLETPSAGSHTRKIKSVLSTSTGTIQGSATAPAVLIVEDIGPAGAPA